jgi:hypothetical protein
LKALSDAILREIPLRVVKRAPRIGPSIVLHHGPDRQKTAWGLEFLKGLAE